MRRRLQGEQREGGFTLIELMVVVLIIVILIAIAIPTFLGARQRAQNRAAQSSLRNALTAAKTIYTDAQSYTGASAAAMLAVEPSLTYAAAGVDSTGQNNVSVSGNAGVFAAAASRRAGPATGSRRTSRPAPPTGRTPPGRPARALTQSARRTRPGRSRRSQA
jgi:type IV pilus assembly protein PilA